MSSPPDFEGSLEAAHRRLEAIRPDDYARTRNHLDGAVTRLSPYITHGFLTVVQVRDHLQSKHGLGAHHKLVFELAWREYFRHVWRHLGPAIKRSMHEGPLPDDCYATELPDDIASARTGLPVIDQAVRSLYSGWLHNHARLWLASYVIHSRKVHWRVGADWMLAHLLDGDLASNHLSWQWVAGTSSSGPYLFNAENVRRYAPPNWHVDGSALDCSYDALREVAVSRTRLPAVSVLRSPPVDYPVPARFAVPPNHRFGPVASEDVAGRDVWLVHPWSLGEPPPGRLCVAILDRRFHQEGPWSGGRWRFVLPRMDEMADIRWLDDADRIVQALKSARSVAGVLDPHLAAEFSSLSLSAPAQAFDEPASACRSFSSWWDQVERLRKAARGVDAA